MRSGIKLGALFGIPLFIDPSWFFILAFVTYLNAVSFSETWSTALAWSAGLALAVLLFVSVLLHELGHSLVARSQGIKVNSITLFLFGGVASIEEESKTPGQAFQVAAAGPSVSIVLFGLFYLLTQVIPAEPGILRVLTLDLARINLVLALFNLIPGLPLDGGQILKAAVWKLTGNRFQGVRWAALTGKLLGAIAIALGLTTFLLAGAFGGLWIGLIGWFIIRNASNYDRLTNLQEHLLQLKAADAMTREFRVVDADMTLRQFADDYILKDSWTSEGANQVYPYYAASDGRYRGLVSVEDLHFIERSLWESKTLESMARPLTDILSVQENTPLVEVINSMEAKQIKSLTVLSPAGAVAGTLDRGDIVRAVASKLKLAVSEADIKRVKAEGTYPPGLQLQAIAKATIAVDS